LVVVVVLSSVGTDTSASILFAQDATAEDEDISGDFEDEGDYAE